MLSPLVGRYCTFVLHGVPFHGKILNVEASGKILVCASGFAGPIVPEEVTLIGDQPTETQGEN